MTVNHGVLGSSPKGGASKKGEKRFGLPNLFSFYTVANKFRTNFNQAVALILLLI